MCSKMKVETDWTYHILMDIACYLEMPTVLIIKLIHATLKIVTAAMLDSITRCALELSTGL